MPITQKELNTLLATHAAPALLGAKPANLLSVPRFATFAPWVAAYNARLNAKGLYLHPMCQCNDKQLLLVYHKAKLVNTLCSPQNRVFLLSYGYPLYAENGAAIHLEDALQHLALRLQEEPHFPHEIGVFLGYPLEDVVGFIANNGCNYKCSGCWKVYGDEMQSRQLFSQYKQCKQQLSHALQRENWDLLHCLCEHFTIENRSV